MRQEQTELATQLARFQARAAAAETGNRQLAEALAALAAAEKSQDGSPVLEDQRVVRAGPDAGRSLGSVDA